MPWLSFVLILWNIRSLLTAVIPVGFPDGSVVKNLPANAGDIREADSIPGSETAPGGRNGNPLQYACLGNLLDRGAWWATVHGVTKDGTQLYNGTTTIKPAQTMKPQLTQPL